MPELHSEPKPDLGIPSPKIKSADSNVKRKVLAVLEQGNVEYPEDFISRIVEYVLRFIEQDAATRTLFEAHVLQKISVREGLPELDRFLNFSSDASISHEEQRMLRLKVSALRADREKNPERSLPMWYAISRLGFLESLSNQVRNMLATHGDACTLSDLHLYRYPGQLVIDFQGAPTHSARGSYLVRFNGAGVQLQHKESFSAQGLSESPPEDVAPTHTPRIPGADELILDWTDPKLKL